MNSRYAAGNELSVDEQAYERTNDSEVEADGFEVVVDEPEFQATVEMEVQAKVDANHPDGLVQHKQDIDHPWGCTLAQEERIEAREAELERISAQATLGRQDGRATRTREVVLRQRRRCWRETVDSIDPREKLSQAELAEVNRQAMRIAREVRSGPSWAAISRRLAERIVAGQDIVDAVLETTKAIRGEPGVVQPIASVDPRDCEATIEGEVTVLFEPASNTQQQVGYVADDSGRIKLTVWERSQQGTVLSEGDRVRIQAGKPGSYRGETTLAVVYESEITILEQGDGPSPIHGTRYAAGWADEPEQDGVSQSPKPVRASASGKAVARPKAARFQGCERWIFPVEACPEWWTVKENVAPVDESE